MGSIRNLQEAAGAALVCLYQGRTDEAIRLLERFELDFPRCRPTLLLRPNPAGTIWAVGIEHQPGDFGMVAGPYPTEQEALDYVATDEKACIICFPPNHGKDPRVLERITHRWNKQGICWEEVKPCED